MSRLGAAALAFALVWMPVARTHAAEPTVAPPPDHETASMLARARAAKTWGGVSLGAGLSLVVASGITWGLRNTALRRADRQKFYVDEQRLIERARRRQVISAVGLATGTTLTVVGVALLIMGATWTDRAHRRSTWVPVVAPGYAGVGATVRF